MMNENFDNITIVEVNSSNVDKYGICCITDKKSEGYKAKLNWFKTDYNADLTILLAHDSQHKRVGFLPKK